MQKRSNPLKPAPAARMAITVILLLAVAPQPCSAGSVGAYNATDAFVEGLIRALGSSMEAARPLRLQEAIATAVANNPGMRAGARLPEAARHGVLEAAAAFEPVVRIDLDYSDANVPRASALAGSELLKENKRKGDVTLSKLLKTGATVDVVWSNNRSSTNSSFQGLVPQYDPTLGLTVEQPLLRDIGAYSTRTTVLIARNTSLQAVANFEAELATFAASVVNAYWDYVLAEAELNVQRHAFELAQDLVEETESRVRVGLLAPVAIKEARADAAADEEKVISASNSLDLAGRTLQYLIMLDADHGDGPLPVKPAERHQVVVMALEKDKSLRTAIEHRAELKAVRLALANAELEQREARNALLPSLDLVGSYTLVGLGGKPIPLVDFNTGELAKSAFGGSYGKALDRLISGDFYRYSVGLKLEVPLSNAAARSRYAKARIEMQRSRDSMRKVISDVALEVERAMGEVASAYKRVSASRLARELAEENLAEQKRRYEVGMVTTTDVLKFQEKLARAMATEAKANADHARAIASLRLAKGTLLEHYGVRVRFEDAPGLPWWARF